MNELFEEVVVWKRISEDAVVKYCCFRDCGDGRVAVQSADFFRLPVDDAQLMRSERQKLELLIECSPRDRCEWFESLEDAISHHDAAFR